MSDDLEQRLAAAAQDMREFEVCGQRCDDLRARQDSITAELAAARERYSGEEKDVERLEGISLTHVLASLRHSRDDSLAREQAEVQAARYRVADTESRLAAVQSELAATEARGSRLAGAPRAYADVLADKERYLTQSAEPRGADLLRLADERGRLAAELTELQKAERIAQAAKQALAQVQDRLGSASSWSTYDTFFGGGMVGNAIKHDRMDEAAQAAAQADRCLSTLRTELTDLARVEPTAPQLQVSAGLKFADIFFNNIFTDLAVAHQIRQAQDTVDTTVQLVADVRDKLASQIQAAQARLAHIENQRRELLTRQ